MPVILLVLLTSSAFALKDGFSYSGLHRKAKFTLTWDMKTLHYTDRGLDLSIPFAECTRKSLSDFMDLEHEYWKDQPAGEPDPILVKKNGSALKISGRSRLGKHLLSLSANLRVLKAQTEKDCKSPRK